MEWYPCDFEANAEDARYINAKALIEFLHERCGEERMMEMVAAQGDACTRRWFRWRREVADNLVDVYSIDSFLVEVFQGDLTLHDLPPQVFSFAAIKRNGTFRGKHCKKTRELAGRRIVKGESPKVIAAEFGRTVDCVNKWARNYRMEKGLAA